MRVIVIISYDPSKLGYIEWLANKKEAKFLDI